MANSHRNGPPTPEEFQKHLTDFMRQHFPSVSAQFTAHTEKKAEPPPPPEPEKTDIYAFDKKPRDVKAYLDRFVIKQDEAKKALAVAICDHYHEVRLAREGKAHPNYTKQNIILAGPTGVGKTYLIRSIAELIGVPFVKGDATKFSETGYVGGDVEDLVRDLVRRAEGDIERAQYGIIYIDEIDKIASSPSANNRDVSGRGVQTNLLKLMEETDVPARSPQDMAGQIQALMDSQMRGKKGASVVNTKHILFIVSGAFPGLDKIVGKRMRQATIGFSTARDGVSADDALLRQVQTQDFIDYGFEPEFIGRLPVRVVCQPLDVDDLFQILKTSEGSIIRQYEQSFSAYGIEATFEESALQKIAELAAAENTGARGLMTICERALRDFKYELPSTNIRRFTVTSDSVQNPRAALDKLLDHEREMMVHSARKFVDEFAEDFVQTHGLRIKITDAAADRLVEKALADKVSIRAFCETRFKDYQFGLKLIAQNTQQEEFTLDVPAVEDPDKTLSDWVVASYRQQQAAAGSPSADLPPMPPNT